MDNLQIEDSKASSEEQSTDKESTDKVNTETSQSGQTPNKSRGLYRYVNVSVRTLNIVIIAGIILIAILISYGVSNNGYTVTFDSNGGSDVESQACMYGDYLEEPAAPSREGYEFIGWYTDENCTALWDFGTDTVSASMELYAGWEEEERHE